MDALAYIIGTIGIGATILVVLAAAFNSICWIIARACGRI